MNNMTIRSIDRRTKPIVTLTGVDGNVFNVIGIVNRGMVEAGWSDAEKRVVIKDMMSEDYDHALIVAMSVCEVS